MVASAQTTSNRSATPRATARRSASAARSGASSTPTAVRVGNAWSTQRIRPATPHPSSRWRSPSCSRPADRVRDTHARPHGGDDGRRERVGRHRRRIREHGPRRTARRTRAPPDRSRSVCAPTSPSRSAGASGAKAAGPVNAAQAGVSRTPEPSSSATSFATSAAQTSRTRCSPSPVSRARSATVDDGPHRAEAARRPRRPRPAPAASGRSPAGRGPAPTPRTTTAARPALPRSWPWLMMAFAAPTGPTKECPWSTSPSATTRRRSVPGSAPSSPRSSCPSSRTRWPASAAASAVCRSRSCAASRTSRSRPGSSGSRRLRRTAGWACPR